MKPIFHAVALLGEYQLKQQGASANWHFIFLVNSGTTYNAI